MYSEKMFSASTVPNMLFFLNNELQLFESLGEYKDFEPRHSPLAYCGLGAGLGMPGNELRKFKCLVVEFEAIFKMASGPESGVQVGSVMKKKR